MRLRTATLSFDLRKSTFCMEQANSPEQFGRWLDELVQILIAVSHLHGGVFDKFTGDGALVHFLENECQVVYEKMAVQAALDCAFDMQRAIGLHLFRLRRFLRMDSRLLGAGIAIDVGDAFWSFDHRDNPITVGQGVVYACRLCDDAKAGVIRLTNIAYESLDEITRRRIPDAQQVLFVSKELKEDMEVTIRQFQTPDHESSFGAGMGVIRALCERVYGLSRPDQGGAGLGP